MIPSSLQDSVPCQCCGEPTSFLGTKLCDPCWELTSKVERASEKHLRWALRNRRKVAIGDGSLVQALGINEKDFEEATDPLIKLMAIDHALKTADARKLVWLMLKSELGEHVVNIESEILAEIENRLFPDYDGEFVTFQEWGWKTPEGDIRYV